MASLQNRLDRIRAAFTEQAPEAVRETMARATTDLRASGILERLPAPGSLLPAFELPDTDGRSVRSTDLLGRGPLVVSVYRGGW